MTSSISGGAAPSRYTTTPANAAPGAPQAAAVADTQSSPPSLDARIDALIAAAAGGEEGAHVRAAARDLLADLREQSPGVALQGLHRLVSRAAGLLEPDALPRLTDHAASQTRYYLRAMLGSEIRAAVAALDFGATPDLGQGTSRGLLLATIDACTTQQAGRQESAATPFGSDVMNNVSPFMSTAELARGATVSRASSELNAAVGKDVQAFFAATQALLVAAPKDAVGIYDTRIVPFLTRCSGDLRVTASVQTLRLMAYQDWDLQEQMEVVKNDLSAALQVPGAGGQQDPLGAGYRHRLAQLQSALVPSEAGDERYRTSDFIATLDAVARDRFEQPMTRMVDAMGMPDGAPRNQRLGQVVQELRAAVDSWLR